MRKAKLLRLLSPAPYAEAQERLSNLTPHTYNGIAAQLVDHAKDAQG